MGKDFKEFDQLFQSFENYSVSVITECEQFKETAIEVGTKIGAFAGAIADGVVAYKTNTENTGGLSVLGEAVGDMVGTAVGNINEQIKYSACKNKILNDGEKWRKQWYPRLQDYLAVKQSIPKSEWFDKPINYFVKFLQMTDFDTTDDFYKYATEILRSHIDAVYYFYYREQRTNDILNYFDHYEEKLDDFEEFITWHEEIRKPENYFSSIADTFYDEVSQQLSSEEDMAKFNQLFLMLYSTTPLMIFSTNALYITYQKEVSNTFTMCYKKKKTAQNFPKFFYQGDGFKSFFDALNISQSNPDDVKGVLKKTNIYCLAGFTWIPIILSIAYYFLQRHFYYKSSLFHYPLLYFYFAVQILPVIVLGIINFVNSRKAGDYILKHSYNNVLSFVVSCCGKAAEIENTRDFENTNKDLWDNLDGTIDGRDDDGDDDGGDDGDDALAAIAEMGTL